MDFSRIKNYIKNNKFGLTLVLCIIIVMLSTLVVFIKGGNIYGDDLYFHTGRILGIYEGLKAGQFPVKYYVDFDNEFSYFSPLFYGDLFLYIPAILMFCGFSLKVSYFIFIYLILFSLFISFYFLSKKILKDKIFSLISSTIFVLSQYIFIDIFFRAAIGEIIAIIFLIWLFYGIYNLLYEDFSKPWIFSISLLGMLYSHMTTLVISCVLLVIVVLFNYKKLFHNKQFWLKALWAFLIFIVCGSYQLFSFIEQYFNGTYKISKPWAILANYSHNIFDMIGGNIYGIGIICILPYIFRFFYKTDNIDEKKNVDKGLIISAIILFMVSGAFPWKQLDSVFKFMQFPWRLYPIPSIILSIIITVELRNFNMKSFKTFILITASLMSFFVCYNNLRCFNSLNYYIKDDINIIYYYEWHPLKAENNTINNTFICDSNANVVDYNRKELTTDFTFECNNSDFYILPIFYYKGYSAYLTTSDGSVQKLNVSENYDGRVIVDTKGKSGTLRVYYEGTMIQNVSFIVSSLGVLYMVSYFVVKGIKNRKNKNKMVA
jgi:hypothetical protein